MTTKPKADAIKPKGPEWREEWLPLQAIAKEPSLQVRARLDPSAVKRYADATRAGHVLPPIKVARVASAGGTMLYLVDGWHRMEAGALQLSRQDLTQDVPGEQVLALVADMTEAEAGWEAANANRLHGVPLKPKEERGVFRAFIGAGRHRRGRAGLRTYEDIAAELGKGKSTIYRWMLQDFPALAKKMAKDSPGNQEAGTVEVDRPSPGQQQVQQAREATQQIIAALPAMSPTVRHEVADLLRAALRAAEGLGMVPPEF